MNASSRFTTAVVGATTAASVAAILRAERNQQTGGRMRFIYSREHTNRLDYKVCITQSKVGPLLKTQSKDLEHTHTADFILSATLF